MVKKKEGLLYLILFVTALLTSFIVFKFYNWNLRVPMGVAGDGIGSVVTATDYFRSKAAWIANVATAYPYERIPLFSNNDGLLINIIYGLIAKIFGAVGYGINITYWLTYPAYALCTCFAMRKLGMSRESTFIGAMVYAFLPGHWIRGIGHIYIGNCWAIPVACLVPLLMLSNKFHEDNYYNTYVKENSFRAYFQSIGWKRIYLFAGMVVTCFLSVYHGFLLFLLIAIVGGVSWVGRRKAVYFFDTVLNCGFVSIWLFIITVLFPKLAGANMFEAAGKTRGSSEIELYGMKLIQLLLPVEGHRINLLSDLTATYIKIFSSTTNENQGATLGLVLAISFTIGMVVLVVGGRKKDDITFQKIGDIAKINVIIILIGEIGGLSSLVALFFYMIRCYNRYSFFIAAYAVFIFGYLMDDLLNRYEWKKPLKIGICVALIVLAVYDQVTPGAAVNKENAEEESRLYYSAEEFVKSIEDLEGGAINAVFLGQQITPKYYMMASSQNINWMDGSLAETIQNYPVNDVLDAFYLLNIDGIVLCPGSVISEDELSKRLGPPLIADSTDSWRYYSMDSYQSIGEDWYLPEHKDAFMGMVLENKDWHFLDEPVYFAGFNGSGYRFCKEGLGESTFYYTWTETENIDFHFDIIQSETVNSDQPVRVTVQVADVFGGEQRLGIAANDEKVFSKKLSGEETIVFDSRLKEGELDIHFHLPDTSSMKDLNLGEDDDTLYGIALQSIMIERLP